MSDPVVLHVIRPYPSADEYLRHEAWTMDARTMLLIGEAELPPGTPITFDVTLGDGSRPIRAEAKVLANVEPTGARPGGLRVRFKRYGASTKTFIDRAVELSERASLRPPPPEPEAPRPPSAAPPPPAEAPAPPPARAHTGDVPASEVPRALEALRGRARTEIESPPERELLLERLRQRGMNEEVTGRYRTP